MRNYFLLFVSIFFLQYCNKPTKKKNLMKTASMHDTMESGSDSTLLEKYKSFYGFVIKNKSQHDFYCVDEKTMFKYISNKQIDFVIIKQDILKSQWFSPISGTSYDYFSWLNFIENEPELDNIQFQVCKSQKRSQIIPVYVTQFNREVNDSKTKKDDCNDFFPSEIYEKTSLNLIYVIPLNYEKANKYLNIRDTLSREKYKTFVENIIAH